MTVHRFFVAPGTITGDRLPLPAEIEHQVRRVLRLADGAELVLLEGDGSQATCRLESGKLTVVSRDPAPGELRLRLTVAQALLKGDHLETVVRAGTEVGVSRFELIVTERTVVRDLSPTRLARLRGIVREAAEQSERGIIPEVIGPLRLDEVATPTSVMLAERSAAPRLSNLAEFDRLVIGPEGGFTLTEVSQAVDGGARLATLGGRILRSETASVAAAAVVLSGAGDLA